MVAWKVGVLGCIAGDEVCTAVGNAGIGLGVEVRVGDAGVCAAVGDARIGFGMEVRVGDAGV